MAYRNWRGPKNKFGAQRVSYGGYSFASGLEKYVYMWLQSKEQAGEIKIECTQDSVYLSKARILYKPDFRVRDIKTDEVYWCEAKGVELPEFKLKKRLWKHYGPGRLQIIKGSKERFKVVEEVIPKTNIGENDYDE